MYANGATAHSGGNRAPGFHFRGEVRGWSYATALRQKRFLWSVNASELSGQGFAVTLTVRELPADAATWTRMRLAFQKRVARLGVSVRSHWVTEWQARGVPHLHAALYAPVMVPLEVGPMRWQIVLAWMSVVESFGYTCAFNSQDCKPIEGTMGWLKYMAKHASRGAAHYQRQGIPDAWRKSGRMWGYTGDWPVAEPVQVEVNHLEMYRLRRIMRAWAVREATLRGDRKRAQYLRRSPSFVTTERESRWQAASEWIPEHVMLRLVDLLDREERR